MKKLAFISVLVVVIGFCVTVSAFAEFYVIPVQNKCGPCKGTRSAGGRWCDNGDGTVTDMTMCLVWLKYADWGGLKPWRNSATSGETRYDDAHTRAGLLASGETINTSGGTVLLSDDSAAGDWRLPTKKECAGFIEGDETVGRSNMQLFEGVDADPYWTSSTSDSDTENAWSMTIGPQSGEGDLSRGACKYYKGILYVWPVRSDN